MLESFAALVLGAKETLFEALEVDSLSCSLSELSCSLSRHCSGDNGCLEALGDRVSDSKDAYMQSWTDNCRDSKNEMLLLQEDNTLTGI